MKCKNCGHKIEEAIKWWKKEGKKYSKKWSGFRHIRQPFAIGSLSFTGRKEFNHFKRCFCGCDKPEPEEVQRR